MKRLILYTLFVAIDLIVIGCSNKRNNQSTDKSENTLNIGVMPTLDCLPIYVADALDLFGKQGLKVRLCCYDAQLDMDTALIGGSVSVAVTDVVRAERLRVRGVNIDYLTATDTRWQLYTARASRIKKAGGLGDKNLAMTRFSATDLLTDVVVGKARPSNSVYRIQVNDVNLRLRMLLGRQVDAAWLAEPQATVARLSGCVSVADSKDEDLCLGAVVVRNEESKPARQQTGKKMDAFRKAYNEAVDSIRKYGARAYASRLYHWADVDRKAVDSLPEIKFSHVTAPREKDVQRAREHVRARNAALR